MVLEQNALQTRYTGTWNVEIKGIYHYIPCQINKNIVRNGITIANSTTLWQQICLYRCKMDVSTEDICVKRTIYVAQRCAYV